MGIIIAGRRIMEQLKANHMTHVVVEILQATHFNNDQYN